MVAFTYAICFFVFVFSEVGENTEEWFEKEMRDYLFYKNLPIFVSDAIFENAKIKILLKRL